MASSLDTSHPLAAVPDVYAALWGDFDNDGLTDVYLCRRGSNQLWRQTEKGRWSNVSGPARAEGAGGNTIDGAMFDADHDGDLDLLLIKSDGASELLNNNGDGTFRPLGAQVGLGGDRRPSSGILVADLDSDRDTDIVVIKKSPPHDVLVNDRAWQYHRDKAFETFVETPMTAVVAGDLDANGRTELYTSGGNRDRSLDAIAGRTVWKPAFGRGHSARWRMPRSWRWRISTATADSIWWPQRRTADGRPSPFPREARRRQSTRRRVRASPAGRWPCSIRRADLPSWRCPLTAAALRCSGSPAPGGFRSFR